MNKVIKCPKCQGAMSLPAGSAGGTFLCPSCKAPLTITIGGQAPVAPSSPSRATFDSLPPPVMPSVQATQQGGQVWREATEQFVDAEERRTRDEAKRSQGRPAPIDSVSSYRPSRKRGSSSSMVSGCLLIGGIVAGLVLLSGIGIAIAFMFLGGSTELALEGYKVIANGSRRVEKSEGDSRTVAVENRFTRSGFLIVVREFPSGARVDLGGYVDNLRSMGTVVDPTAIQKAGLAGIRYRFLSNSKASPPHIGEIYSLGNKAMILMYIPGDEFLALQGKKSRYRFEQQNKIDAPDDFFSSFQKAN